MSTKEDKEILENIKELVKEYKGIWNEAIDAAANVVESRGSILIAHDVRRLKK